MLKSLLRSRELNFSEAKKILIPYLNERNTRVEMTPERFKEIMENELNEKFGLAIQRLEEVTGKPLAVNGCAKIAQKKLKKFRQTRFRQVKTYSF